MTEINGNIESAQTSVETVQTSAENAEVNTAADDFMAALFDGDETGEVDVVDTAAGDEPTAAESPEGENQDGEQATKGDDKGNEQKFTLKILGEDKEVDLEEMQRLAQKGGDYDRIREGYDDYKNQVAQYKEQLAAWQELTEISGMGAQEFVQAFQAQMFEGAVEAKKQEIQAKEMVSDELAERMARAEVELENRARAAEKAARKESVVTQQPAEPPKPTVEQQQEAQKQALAAEIAKLQQDFPELAEPGAKFPDEVVEAVQSGKASLSDSYRNYVIKKQKEEIKQMEQTAKNKAKSIGSMKSDGNGDEVDEFVKELLAEG